MIAKLAEISAKPSTPGREKAKANIKAALAKEFDHAAKAPKGRSVARALTVYDREQLMTLADSSRHNAQVRQWARKVLGGNGEISKQDARLLRDFDGSRCSLPSRSHLARRDFGRLTTQLNEKLL